MLFNPDGSYRAKAQRGVDATPMHRMGHPNELIGTLVWLASDASSYVTGITVTVRRGVSPRFPGLTAGGRLCRMAGKPLGKERERFRMTSPLCARGASEKDSGSCRFFGSGKRRSKAENVFGGYSHCSVA